MDFASHNGSDGIEKSDVIRTMNFRWHEHPAKISRGKANTKFAAEVSAPSPDSAIGLFDDRAPRAAPDGDDVRGKENAREPKEDHCNQRLSFAFHWRV
jgi:hypothetical protein